MSLPEALAGDLSLRLRRAQADHRIPSASAAVFRDGEPIWSEAVGLADVERGEEATPQTQYRVGSITKTFTAAAVLALRDDGLLGLDDALERHVPGTPHGTLTLRRLLSHLSGVQREPVGDIWDTLEPPTRDELLARLPETEQVLPAGERFHYSNLAFALLGEVVARASGGTYEAFLEERLLRPLQLGRTTWAPAAPVATGYFVDPWSDAVHAERPVDVKGVAAAAQLWSTTADLARWADFLAGKEELHVLQAMADTERWTRGFGLGLCLWRRGERLLAGHGGAMPGFLAGLAYDPRRRIGAVLLTASTAGVPVEALTLDLAAAALDGLPEEPKAWRPSPAPPEVAELLGSWWSEGEELVLRHRSGRLEAVIARLPDAPPSVFEQIGPDRFRTVEGRERGELLLVVRDAVGAVERLAWATYWLTRAPRAFGA